MAIASGVDEKGEGDTWRGPAGLAGLGIAREERRGWYIGEAISVRVEQDGGNAAVIDNDASPAIAPRVS